jgi:hypothetical protein
MRLMGFQDDFKQVVSDTQAYRQAGNSIVVDVLIAILKQIILFFQVTIQLYFFYRSIKPVNYFY